MTNINDHLASASPEYDVYTFNFNAAEVEEINSKLLRGNLVDEIAELIKEDDPRVCNK